MIILHITSITKPKGNGVAEAVRNYCYYEGKTEKVALYNLESAITANGANHFEKDHRSIESLPEPFNKPDIVVFNEVYKIRYLKLYKECIKRSIPYIIIPHGCLTDKAQNNKIIKKKVGNLLFFNSFIKNASAIQFLNQKELNDTKKKYRKSIISGNGIDEPERKPVSTHKKIEIIYIGRYDIHTKGLDLIINTCKNNSEWFRKNKVVIQLYGRDSKQSAESITKMLKKNKIIDIIKVNGPIFGSDKEKVLIESYAFLQTSRHEGSPMGIIEALSYGIPCIVTYGTSYGEYINESKSGIGIDFSEKQLFDAIRKIVEDRNFRNTCSKNASRVTDRYSWKIIISECVKEYEKII